MAATARRALTRLGAALALAVVLYLAAAWIGSSLPRNPAWVEPRAEDPDAVEILVESNGVHTALVVPLLTRQKDWRSEFPAGDVPASGRPYSHLSISWGEREVFLDTPTWWDLRPRTVVHILFGGGDALLHVAHYVRPAPAEDIRPLRLSGAAYAALVRQIEQALPARLPGKPRSHYRGYGDYDAFYEAGGHYTYGNTCNQWTSDTLAAAGVKTGRWTPLAGGVMKWIAKPGKQGKR